MDLLTEDDKDPEDDGGLANLRCLDSLGFLSGDDNIVMKPSSISNAWRQGATPVQKKQQQQLVSIEKLLATNQLHSVLRGVTPAKSPLLAKQKFTGLKTLDRTETAAELTVLEELSRGAKNTLEDSKTE